MFNGSRSDAPRLRPPPFLVDTMVGQPLGLRGYATDYDTRPDGTSEVASLFEDLVAKPHTDDQSEQPTYKPDFNTVNKRIRNIFSFYKSEIKENFPNEQDLNDLFEDSFEINDERTITSYGKILQAKTFDELKNAVSLFYSQLVYIKAEIEKSCNQGQSKEKPKEKLGVLDSILAFLKRVLLKIKCFFTGKRAKPVVKPKSQEELDFELKKAILTQFAQEVEDFSKDHFSAHTSQAQKIQPSPSP